jgi:hypothetical protein
MGKAWIRYAQCIEKRNWLQFNTIGIDLPIAKNRCLTG